MSPACNDSVNAASGLIPCRHGRLRPALNLPVGRTIIRVDRWFAARPRAPAAGRGEPSGTSAAACTDFYGPGMNHRDLRWPIELLELRDDEAQRLFRRVLAESHQLPQRLHAPALLDIRARRCPGTLYLGASSNATHPRKSIRQDERSSENSITRSRFDGDSVPRLRPSGVGRTSRRSNHEL